MNFGVNFQEHHSRHDLFVFEYVQVEMADYFEELLKKEGIPFDREIHEKNKVPTTFFGVNKRHLKTAKQLNYLAFARYRKPFISDPILRYFTLTLALVITVLIILGYINS